MSRKIIQFDLRFIMIIIFVISAVMAVVSKSDSLASNVLMTVLLANFAGAVTALIVTFVLRFPRDGSLRNKETEDDVVDSQA